MHTHTCARTKVLVRGSRTVQLSNSRDNKDALYARWEKLCRTHKVCRLDLSVC